MTDRYMPRRNSITEWVVWDNVASKRYNTAKYTYGDEAKAEADKLNKEAAMEGKTWKQMVAEQKIDSPEFAVGDYVRSKQTGKVKGKVTALKTTTWAYIDGTDLGNGRFSQPIDELELAPRLTPEQAWAQVPLIALRYLLGMKAWGAERILPYDHSQIRHETYKVLGGAGVKITNEVKAEVRALILDVATSINIDMADAG